MQKNTLAFVIVAAIGGFIVGFWLANSLNRSVVSSPPAPSTLGASNSASASGASETELSDEEIRTKIADADDNPTNFAFQKDLGLSLYRYAAIKQSVPLMNETVRILGRAKTINEKDFDVLTALGNAHFDLGFYNKDAASFQTARDVYEKSLAIRPGEPDVMTDFGLTYFLQDPPAYDKAAAELQKVSDANPKHERSLQFLVRTFLKQNKTEPAEKALNKLKGINPASSAVQELNSLLAAQTGTAK